MRLEKTKLSILIFTLSLGLSGCVSDKNSDTPVDDTPEVPAEETPEAPADTNSNLPLYEGTSLYHIKDLNVDTNPDTLRRVTRAVSGATILFTDQERAIDGAAWSDLSAPSLSSYVYNATTDAFVAFDGTSYTFEGDSNAYVYRITGTDIKIDVDHFKFDATSQNIKDTASLVFGFDNLPPIIDGAAQFVGDEEIYLETQEFIDDATMYLAGKKDDANNCLMWDASASSETVETTLNCNFVTANGMATGMSGNSITPLVNEDPASAPVIKASAFFTSDFRLKADVGSTEQGDLIPGATENVIGAWSMTTLNGRDAILVQLADVDSVEGYANTTPWQNVDSFYLVQDQSKLRIAPIFLKETGLKDSVWLMGNNGISRIENAITAPATP